MQVVNVIFFTASLYYGLFYNRWSGGVAYCINRENSVTLKYLVQFKRPDGTLCMLYLVNGVIYNALGGTFTLQE